MTTTIESFFKVGRLLVPVVDFHGRLADDHVHVAGAIDLYVDGRPVITRVEWDLVNQLWADLINLCEGVAKGEAKTTSFPDQPIELAMMPRGSQVEISLQYPGVDRRALESSDVFFVEIVRAGTLFFDNLGRVLPSARNQCAYELARLGRLSRS